MRHQGQFLHNGVSVRAKVIDRGPYKGYDWDLTKKTAKRLGFLEVGSDRSRPPSPPQAYPGY